MMMDNVTKCINNIHAIWCALVFLFILNFLVFYTEFFLPGVESKYQHRLIQNLQELAKHRQFYLKNKSTFNERNRQNDLQIDIQKESRIRLFQCLGCFETHFLYESPDICNISGLEQKVDIFIVITTAYHHKLQRNVLRSTWLKPIQRNTGTVRYSFVLGQTDQRTLKTSALRENSVYRDMIFANFTDSYKNLTLKSIAAFKWITKWCSQAKYVMKTDDDMFINLENLVNLSKKFSNELQNSVIGACWKRKPVRKPKTKYYIPNSSYSPDTYPRVCSGTGYFTSFAVIERIVNISVNTPFVYLEDVFIAICLEKLGIVTRNHPGFLSDMKNSISMCTTKTRHVISVHTRTKKQIEHIWKENCRQSLLS